MVSIAGDSIEAGKSCQMHRWGPRTLKPETYPNPIRNLQATAVKRVTSALPASGSAD